MSDLHLSISGDILDGALSFNEIAEKYNVPFNWVNQLAIELAAEGDTASDEYHDWLAGEDFADGYDESMDGDFDSAMASAGHGTDEDYGYYGADEY
jgi:hypothetical protein